MVERQWFDIRVICFFAVVVCFGLVGRVVGERAISAAELQDRLRGFWLAQLIGNAAGRATEGQYRYGEANPNASVPWVLKQQWDADDDTDLEYLAIHILETDGLGCGVEALRRQWLEHITSRGIYIANRQSWFLMADGHLPPETGSRAYNMHWYSIDAQITTEVLGAVCPGMVQQSIDLAGRFAGISNEGFPVHAAQLYAAMNATAFFESDVSKIVGEGLKAIPSTSRTYRVAQDVLAWHSEDAADGQPDWRGTRRKLYDHYQGEHSCGRYYNWLESTINTGATILALLYGGGDFKETVQIAVLAGWDSDCNPATAGGLIGIITGYSGLPADLTDASVCGDTYVNVFRPYLPDEDVGLPQYDSVLDIATRAAELAVANIVIHGGYSTGDGSAKVWHIPSPSGDLITDPEKADPAGPGGLVGEAFEAGLTVDVSAAVEYRDPDDDRRNLAGIIDGIKDNSHNGHRAYSSYTSAQTKPERDWYQVAFSRPVLFAGLTFYEGDLVWDRINDYCRVQNARGGFFEDLTVEVLKGGKYVACAELVMDAGLDPYAMHQAITFSFSPIVGSAIRVIGKAGGAMQFTTIMELEVQGSLDTGLYVEAVTVNGGQSQRSNVDRIDVTFSEDVTIAPDAFRIVDKTGDVVFSRERVHWEYDEASKRAILSFDTDADGAFGDSLLDGLYALQMSCSGIVNAAGRALLDDDGEPADGYYSAGFHRLYGDADGSGRVDLHDFTVLCSLWRSGAGFAGLDIDGDGSVQLCELAGFGDNWLIELDVEAPSAN